MRILPILLLAFVIGSCSKKHNTQQQPAACNDKPPTDELCTAVFQRWFYNSNTNTCELIGYSGCNLHGFATQSECEVCDCNANK